ncbi:excalibur calcium-binding domain-containing protein [[Haemophilus] ducreyi]|uniref:excalibur calcium-binding domain-containing protein n=1 Tax=Haemophilus ducreyi TaxID=730 RepID=UPI0006561806|nr:excalibur calcium-binding domain-containing protein [[Haemophilus] ducreyi]AKO45701.1 nuclease [[Haemophilus] ducreyi]AKO47087.1 nuclease [[Haemophilus] ducreyi]AKO48432.1 nuclease [[Haemophilus] ducreyi]AKO49817.1 nuclease [[Haemophilus] ducreyi]ANF62139.1 nuclease [[Haemophilus] ducreyi]
MKKYIVMLAFAGVATFALAQTFTCSKRTCGQMDSCEEARFHLTQCGVKSLDRDNDGIPCESICGGKKKK